MIHSVRIQNFKSLRDVSIRVDRLTVFVGPNASGKTSVLQAINLLCRAYHEDENLANQEIWRLISHHASGPPIISANLGLVSFRTVAQTDTSNTPQHFGMPQMLGSMSTVTTRSVTIHPDSSSWAPWDAERSYSSTMPFSELLRLEASKLVQSELIATDKSRIEPDGSGLHKSLSIMNLNDPDSWDRLNADVRRIIPSIKRLRHDKNEPPALIFDTKGAIGLPATQISEGTLLVVGLLALLHAPDRPNLILLDDLDRGLHPKAQKELISLMRELLEVHPELQILASTHSPYLLNSLHPDEVRMTLLLEDGSTVCRSLTEHPKFAQWKDEMAPGEMWSLFGEKWLAEKGAAA